jgi:hypothetical protein
VERMKKKNRENGGRGRGRRHFLYGGPVARCEEEKGRGSRGLAPRGGENEEERGGARTQRLGEGG